MKPESNLKNMVIVLTMVTAVAAALLGFVFTATKGPIEEIKQKTVAEAVQKVISGDADVQFNVDAPVEKDGFVFHRAFNPDGKIAGTAVESSVNGFGGKFKVMVGFSPEGDILGYEILEQSETPGLGAKAASWFKEHSIVGANPGDKSFALKKDGGEVDAITAATITSKAFLKAINQAYEANFGFTAVDGVSGASSVSKNAVEPLPKADPAKGRWKGTGLNLNGSVSAIVTIRKNRIASVSVKDNSSTYAKFSSPFKSIPSAMVLQQTDSVDAVTGATYTSEAIREAVRDALAQARGERPATDPSAPISFSPGTYTAEGQGYGGKLKASVSFSENAVTAIKVLSHRETAHVGDVAFPKMTEDIIAANGIGVDAVSGATFSSHAVKEAVLSAAMQAGLNNREAFFSNTVEKAPGEDIEDSWDIVIVGGGGAGLCAAAQAAQEGLSVLIIEKNAELGGNTLVSGGTYQATDHSLVWDPRNPEATSAIGFDGKPHNKVRATVGCVSDLKTILGWNEGPFDAEYYLTHEFVAGDIDEQAKHGVHEDFLPVLLELKKEIRAYLAYAEPKLARGIPENSLTLFSTTNLHIFQTYYGGLRQSVRKDEWIHGDRQLIEQFVVEGEKIKPWLMDMGVGYTNSQSTLVGALWYRGNSMTGCTADLNGDGTPERYSGNWGSYVVAPLAVMLNADKHNQVLRSTSAGELITENGRVTGVKATMEDGTKVTAHASKGVIIATGGYAANIQKVLKTNRYWSRQYLSANIGTTNRSSLRGDGIDMAEAIGAATEGMGFTQLMPLAYAIDGEIAFGGVENAICISPATGKRYVDECSERDVLSLNAFRNGVEKDNAKGVYFYVTRGFSMNFPGMAMFGGGDNPGKEWTVKVADLGSFLSRMGFDVDAETICRTITNYDKAVMAGEVPEDAGKRHPTDLIGSARRNADGSYDPSTYSLENGSLRIRLLSPSTHHTMGGLKVDLDRHVLDANGNIIPGLYAAGEVTGGFFGGNRLGGNALTEVMVSGRIAARTIASESK